MIRLDQVTRRYRDGQEAVAGVSLAIERGEMVFVTGRSGAGKSTLLKLIAGIDVASSGSVQVNGQNVGRLKPAAVAVLRRNIGIVFQDHKLLFDRSVWENAALPLLVAGLPGEDVRRRVSAALEKVGLRARDKAFPEALSGGERQRLCIARAVVNRPSLLLADEPTGNLDAEYAQTIAEMFRSFNQVGVTVVIATHDNPLVERYGRRVVHLEGGRLVSDGPPAVAAGGSAA